MKYKKYLSAGIVKGLEANPFVMATILHVEDEQVEIVAQADELQSIECLPNFEGKHPDLMAADVTHFWMRKK